MASGCRQRAPAALHAPAAGLLAGVHGRVGALDQFVFTRRQQQRRGVAARGQRALAEVQIAASQRGSAGNAGAAGCTFIPVSSAAKAAP